MLLDSPVLTLIDAILVKCIGVVELAGLGQTVRRRMPKVVCTLCPRNCVSISVLVDGNRRSYEQAAAQSAVSKAVAVNNFAPMYVS